MRWPVALLLGLLSSCALVSGVGDLRVDDGAPSGGDAAQVDGDIETTTPPDGSGGADRVTPATGTLTGTITNPGGTRPVYGAAVYVPSTAVAAFPPGVACDTCANLFSGLPAIASTISRADGTFTLDGIPPGAPFSLVIQLGHFRRQVTVPGIAASATAVLPPALAHLPSTQLGGVSGAAGEGDLPQIALTTGSSDQIECALQKVGIALSEFTSPAGGGRVHFYNFGLVGGFSGAAGAFPGAGVAFPGAGAADALVGTRATLDSYNAVILACTGGTANPTAPQQANVLGWYGSGGRLLASHDAAPDFTPSGVVALSTVATNNNDRGPPSLPVKVDTSFVQGSALASWLTSAGSKDPVATLSLSAWRHAVDSVSVPSVTRWLSGDSSLAPVSHPAPAGPLVAMFSYDAPLGMAPQQQCGRVVVPEMHVTDLMAHASWPAECTVDTTMTPEELAFEFMLFRSMACLAPVTAAPPKP